MKPRIITLKYNGTCKRCGDAYIKGERAAFIGKGHIECRECFDHSRDYSIDTSVSHVYSPVSGQSYTRCNCEDYPCCGH